MAHWHGALIDAAPQSMKTRKAFEVLVSKLRGLHGDVLCLFITQANSTLSAIQIINRVRQTDDLIEIFPRENVTRSLDFDTNSEGNALLVDFWNTKNTNRMIEITRTYQWEHVFVVIDEAEQGGYTGVSRRLGFVESIEKAAKIPIKVILITATIANLSDCVYRYFLETKTKDGIVHKLVNETCVEKYNAKPHPDYVGTSWYKNTSGTWRELKIQEQDKIPFRSICRALKELPDENKQLCFIVSSTRKATHRDMANRMFRLGFNVTVELNSTNTKNYSVMYDDDAGETKEWKIPYTALEKLARSGTMSTYTSPEDGLEVDTGIDGYEDLTLSHVLQASLRMGTNYHRTILQKCSDYEKMKLIVIFSKITGLDPELKRPRDFPKDPKIALIGGAIASRGNTIQNPFIGFTFTSSLYYNRGGSQQRGAINAQAIGRSNGTLLQSYKIDIKPIMISTKRIMRDGLANEAIVMKKAAEFENGALISLKDLVTKREWDIMLKETDEKFVDCVKVNEIKMQKDIMKLYMTTGKNELSLSEIRKAGIPIDTRKRWSLTELAAKGYVTHSNRSVWKITESGKIYAASL